MREVQRCISANEYKNVYLLYGDEAYLRIYYKNALKNALTDPSDNLNYSYFEGSSISVDEVISITDTLPFLAERRLVVVENSGWFTAGNSDDDNQKASGRVGQIIECIERIQDEVVLVFVEEKADKRSKLFKAVARKGICEEYGHESEEALAGWAVAFAGNEHMKISPASAMYLISEVGCDMYLLSLELSKLCAYCMERGEITIKDIDAVCTHQITGKIFDMISAISRHDQTEALRLYYDLVNLRESPYAILSLLTRQYRQMLEVRDLFERNQSKAAIASKLEMKDWLAGKMIDAVRKYPKSDLRDCLEACERADEDIKTGKLGDTLSIELLIISCSQAKEKRG